MDIADLRLLIAVAELGSFSAAGAAVRLSQPAVSQRIAAIERAVGAVLFVRDSRGARLTAAGERYLGYARRSVQLLADGARAAASELPGAGLVIGAPASYAPPLASSLLAAAEDCVISIRTGHSRHLIADVIDERLDAAIVSTGIVPAGLTSGHLLESPVVALLTPGHATRPNRYAVHTWAAGVDAITTDLLGRGIGRHLISIVSPAGTAVSLAARNEAIAVVPRICAETEIDQGVLVEDQTTRLPAITAHLSCVYQARTERERVTRFIKQLTDQFNHGRHAAAPV